MRGNPVNRLRVLPLPMLLLGLYGFIVALTGFKEVWALAFSSEASGGAVQAILDLSLSSPISALFCGLVITSLIQSSSATIAIVVATVGSGVISPSDSVFVILGANVGTTVTNTIVGLAYGHKQKEFALMTPAILVDDLYKLFNVALFFVLEVATGFLHRLSDAVVNMIGANAVAGNFFGYFPDLIDLFTKPVTDAALGLISAMPLAVGMQAIAGGILFFALLMLALGMMGEALEAVLQDHARQFISRVFDGKAVAFGLGFLICWLLQSSSVAVSLLLPLVGQAAVSLPTVYFYSVGAALATTCDAGQILSYLKFGTLGLSAGLVHIFLNLFGALLFLTVPGLRELPLRSAQLIAGQINRGRHGPALLLLYVLGLFFGLPLVVIMLLAWFQ